MFKAPQGLALQILTRTATATGTIHPLFIILDVSLVCNAEPTTTIMTTALAALRGVVIRVRTLVDFIRVLTADILLGAGIRQGLSQTAHTRRRITIRLIMEKSYG